jgi:hypothetical protein
MTVELEDIDDPHFKPDFRRANGAPMVMDENGVNQRLSRPSGWGHVLDDENALVNWKLNRAIEGVAKDKALQARAAAAKEDDRGTWKELREAAINAGRGDQAADIGTALHAMSERWEDPDDDFRPGEPYESHLTQYTLELERLGLASEYTEVHMVNMEWRAAGTADRLYRLSRDLIAPTGEIVPAGSLVMGDLKTGKSLNFSAPGYSVQLAIYAGSRLYDVLNDEFLDTPEINQDWGLLVHMPSDRPECEILWVSLEAGRWGAYLVAEVRKWRKNWRSGEHALSSILAPEAAEMGEVISIEEADAEWIARNAEWCVKRLDCIRDNPDARKRLQILWPEDIPPKDLREGKLNLVQMMDAMKLISRIEAEFSLGFVEGQPSTGKHAGEITNTPPSLFEVES